MHRVVLGSPAVLRATMAMEQNKWRKSPFDDATAPVFICGLARSGSTLLLNRLNATGDFSTSTYRHMPFVLAPNMWSSTSKSQRLTADDVERAHGDGMTHSFDSEEAFEEVFWRATNDPAKLPLLPWNAPITVDDMAQFRLFITSVVKAGLAPRYLSKNNNNVTRIPVLLKTAKTAQVVVPFRDPVGFVGSTLVQHKRFLETAKTDAFAAKYMAWLGHYEFGPLFKPAGAPGVVVPDAVTPEYLCQYWIKVNTALLETTNARVHFFDYDGFCAEPDARLTALGEVLDVDLSAPDDVHPPHEYSADGIAGETLKAAKTLLQALKSRAV